MMLDRSEQTGRSPLSTYVSAASRTWGGTGLFNATLAIVAVLTVVRLVGLKYSVVDLFYDEAQYWSWSRALAFGYFTKPPLLAWIIAAAERVCGSEEWCVRAPAPILYLATSLSVYALGKTLYDELTGFWAALLTAFATGAVFSARIISTDVPLLFFWAVALLAYAKLLLAPSKRWTLVLGISIGLGMLSKYAMIYFLPGLLLSALVSTRARALLAKPTVWIALAIAIAVLAPNIYWNVANSFVTVEQTGRLVLEQGMRPSLMRGLEFLAAQFAVFGPIVFAVLILAMLRFGSDVITEHDRVMLAFALPPLAIVTGFAITVHAYANWAATSFIPAVVVVAAILSRRNARFWLYASLGLGVVIQSVFLYTDAVATRIALPFLASPNPYHRTLGWRDYGQAVGQLAQRAGAATIVNDSRGELSALLYYWRDKPEKILSWRTTDIPNFDLTQPLTPSAQEPILFVSSCPQIERIRPAYSVVEPLGAFLPAGDSTWIRGFYAFKLSGNRGPIQTLAACVRR